jgi:murein DD-endopeptidase MepM/ murein hydrolase activator NlpD
VIEVSVRDAVTLSGSLTSDKEYPLNFFPHENENTFVALQGVHAMTVPGAYPLKLQATYADGRVESYEQRVLITSGGYPDDPILIVEPEYLDPTISDEEMNELLGIVLNPSKEQRWSGAFSNPSVFEDCFTSRYGNRREYRADDGSVAPYFSFHSGLDFCGGTGLEIDATASGVVVMAQDTIVRGKATVIDHGWGVFSGYFHQDAIYVQEGQTVEPGQVIGLVGATGRVTGAHLHWEIWVNGVQVNPMAWLNQSFP